MSKTIRLMIDLIGLQVKTGSPGHEDIETIQKVYLSETSGSERVAVEFASGYFTNMSKADLDLFLEEGEVEYVRFFGKETDRALEVMMIA